MVMTPPESDRIFFSCHERVGEIREEIRLFLGSWLVFVFGRHVAGIENIQDFLPQFRRLKLAQIE